MELGGIETIDNVCAHTQTHDVNHIHSLCKYRIIEIFQNYLRTTLYMFHDFDLPFVG